MGGLHLRDPRRLLLRALQPELLLLTTQQKQISSSSNDVEFCATHSDHEKSQIKSDVEIVTSKNIYAMVKRFCEDTETEYDDPLIRLKMTKHGYGFVNVSPNNISRA